MASQPPVSSKEPGQGFQLNRPTIITLLYFGGFATGVSAIVGLVLAYVWKNEPHDGWMDSHFRYLIRTFWLGIVWAIVAGIGSLVTLGLLVFILFPLVTLWFIARNVNALVKAQHREAIANPQSWLI